MIVLNSGRIPNVRTYPLLVSEFWDIVEMCQQEGFIKGVYIEKDNFQDIKYLRMDNSKLTFKGVEFLHKNSDMVRSYEDRKNLKEWLQF